MMKVCLGKIEVTFFLQNTWNETFSDDDWIFAVGGMGYRLSGKHVLFCSYSV